MWDEIETTFSGNEDVLVAALGPEHSGYVRAKGYGTTPTSYFSIPPEAQEILLSK